MTQAPHPSDYEYKTYGNMRFEVKQGYYSIEDLKKLLAHCEEMKERSDAYLLKNMAVIKPLAK